MSDSGWFRYHRSMDKSLYRNKPDYHSVWCYILSHATHRPYKTTFGKESNVIMLETGQLITSINSIMSVTGVNYSKTRRILKNLKSDYRIDYQTSTVSTLITVVNWCQYQQSEHQSEQPVNNQRITSEQPVTTNNNTSTQTQQTKDIVAKATLSKTSSDDEYSFDKFWNIYNKKKSKQKCEKRYSRISKKDKELIFEHLKEYIPSTESNNAEYRLHPHTYLNGARWLDEVNNKNKVQSDRFLRNTDDIEWDDLTYFEQVQRTSAKKMKIYDANQRRRKANGY